MDSTTDRRASPPALTSRRGPDADPQRSGWEPWPARSGEAIEVFVAREPSASFHLHWHEEWSLGAIAAGECAFSCDGRAEIARAGDLVVIPPLAVHTAGTSAVRFAMTMLYLPAGAVSRRLRLDPSTTPVLARHRVSRPALARALARAAGSRSSGAVWPILREALAACRASPRADRPLVPVDRRVARIAAILRSADGVPDVGALAGAVGLSREHLHRLFRATLGVTPGQYVRLSRIALARRRLRRGERIAEVALACGFTDQAHFSRWFRRYHGVTPGVFTHASAG